MKPSLQFVSWNQEGWKTGLCSVPPVGHSHSLLALANNTCIKPTFIELKERFMKLYKKKVCPKMRSHTTILISSFVLALFSILGNPLYQKKLYLCQLASLFPRLYSEVVIYLEVYKWPVDCSAKLYNKNGREREQKKDWEREWVGWGCKWQIIS